MAGLDLTQTQWMWIIGIIVAILVMGSVGYYFTTRGSAGPRGVSFQTGFGVGDPGYIDPEQRSKNNPSSYSSY